MAAQIEIIQTQAGWKVIAKDATELKVEVVGDELIVKVRPTPESESQPLDVKLAK